MSEARLDNFGFSLAAISSEVIADHIAARIKRGELKPGDRLPSEVAIASDYKVARMTAHRAMIELRERGW